MHTNKLKEIQEHYAEILKKRAQNQQDGVTPPMPLPSTDASNESVASPWIVTETLSEEDLAETLVLLRYSYRHLRYRHLKRGTLYEIVDFSLQCGEPDEYAVIYVPLDGNGRPIPNISYSRAARYFFDGRFERVDG